MSDIVGVFDVLGPPRTPSGSLGQGEVACPKPSVGVVPFLLGAVAGAVVGAALGNQFGETTGRVRERSRADMAKAFR